MTVHGGIRTSNLLGIIYKNWNLLSKLYNFNFTKNILNKTFKYFIVQTFFSKIYYYKSDISIVLNKKQAKKSLKRYEDMTVL